MKVMNTVEANTNNENTQQYKAGDLFVDEFDAIYILSKIEETIQGNILYSCIDLATGNRFRDPRIAISKAIEGLQFYKRDAHIIVK